MSTGCGTTMLKRYAELTGWKAPAAGGPMAKQLSLEQKRIEKEARLPGSGTEKRLM